MRRKGMDEADIDRLTAHRTFPGDRPSTTIVYDRLDPYALGRLIALFEHKVFVQGAIWGVNSYDQWGVELGKNLANQILKEWNGESSAIHDPSTNALMQRMKQE